MFCSIYNLLIYFRLYYQYNLDRLSVCTLTVHALLHVADDILYCGPCWTTWSFYGERFCYSLQNDVGSRSLPFANLSNRLLYYAYLAQITCRYGLDEVLSFPGDVDELDEEEALTTTEQQYENCMSFYFVVWTIKLILTLKRPNEHIAYTSRHCIQGFKRNIFQNFQILCSGNREKPGMG